MNDLPPLASIGLTSSTGDDRIGIIDDRWVITTNKESLAMATWGINLSYLHELVKACGGRETLASFTTANICSVLVKPLTADHQSSVCEVLTMADTIPFNQPTGSSEKVFLWIDLFVFSQHREEEKPFEWWQTTFITAVKTIKNVIMVLQPWDDPIPLKRSWCILEVLACDLGLGRFHIALSPKENQRLLKDLQDEYSHDGMLSRVSSERSQTTNDDDRVKIFELIKRLTSFSALDRLVLSTYNAALTKLLEQQLEAKRLEGSTLDILPAQLALITFKMSLNQYQDAKNLSDNAVKVCENELDDDHPLRLTSQLALGLANSKLAFRSVAEDIMLDCLGKCMSNPSIGENHILTIKTQSTLGNIYTGTCDFVKAETFYNTAITKAKELFGLRDILVLKIKGDLCQMYCNQSNYGKAEKLLHETLETSSSLLGDNHPQTLRLADRLGRIYWEMGKFTEGKVLLMDLLQRQQRLVGPNHIDSLKVLVSVGTLYDNIGQFDQSEPLKIEALERLRVAFGPEHPNTLAAMNNLASLYTRMGNYDKAEPLIHDCVEILKRTAGPTHRNTLIACRTLGSLYLSQKRVEEAHTTYLNAWNVSKEHLGLDFGETLRLQGAVAQTYGILKDFDTSERLFIDCIERMERVFGSENIDTLAKRRQYGTLLNWRGDYQKAVESLSGTLAKSKTFLGEGHAETTSCAEVLRYSVNKEFYPSIV
ncbi:Kinesin light chain 3 [Blyttiomyces sp. JEL0837]|nr:Kinesin light chain 3 [Blyttiomyces sp. JEL0837]